MADDKLYRLRTLQERFDRLSSRIFSDIETSKEELMSSEGRQVLDGLTKLDSGDAWQAPPERYTRSLSQHYSERAGDIRRYGGPTVKDALRVAVESYVNARFGLGFGRDTSRLEVYVGAGSVQLYESVLRLIVRRRGDCIFVSYPTYGFFLPQIERLGATPLCVDCELDGGTSLSPETVEYVIRKKNRELRQVWEREIRARVTSFKLKKLCDNERIDQAVTQLRDSRSVAAAEGACIKFAQENDIAEAEVMDGIGIPRVVGYLHLNPDIYGNCIESENLAAYASVFKKYQLTVIEDMSYDGMCLESGPQVSTMLASYPDTYTILGLSKTFALADERIGILVAKRFEARLLRIIEGTVGFTSEARQTALSAVLSMSSGELTDYFSNVVDNCREGLRRKLDITSFIIHGGMSAAEPRAEFIRNHVFNHLRDLHTLSNGVLTENVITEHIASALKGGLGRWLSLGSEPKHGFFLILNCKPLMSSVIGRVEGLTTSLECFEYLYLNYGVRLLPEEAMNPVQPGFRLRLTFSANYDALVLQLACILVGLEFRQSCLERSERVEMRQSEMPGVG